MSKTITADIKKSVKDNDVRFLRLAFTDINGTSKAVEVPTSQLDKVLTNDIRFDGSSIDGFVRLEESDMVLYPDFSTWAVLPWGDEKGGKIGRLVCSVHKTNGEPFEGDPRNNLKRVLKEMKEMGFTDFDIGFEAEFHLFKLGEDGNWTTEVPDHASYFDMTSDDAGARCRRDIVETLESIGFEVEAAHHEVGGGQQEIDFRFDDALTTADRVQTFKMVVREVARKHGLYATFMAKPVEGQAGNGMHTNMSLFKDGKNVFYDKDGEFHFLPSPEKPDTWMSKNHIDPILALAKFKTADPGQEKMTQVALENGEWFATVSKVATPLPMTEVLGLNITDINTARQEVISKVTLGEWTVEEGMNQYKSKVGSNIEACLKSLNAQK